MFENRWVKTGLAALILALLVIVPLTVVFAGGGQPNQSCGAAISPNTPGNAASASGSAFNPDGKAGTVYAGQQPQNSNNPMAVSQYDVACLEVSTH